MTSEELKKYVQKLRGEAQERLRADRIKLFPDVPDEDFEAFVNSVGDTSILEVRFALYKLQNEIRKKHGKPERP